VVHGALITGLLLVLVLVLHWVALRWFQGQTANHWELTKLPQPLFFRTLQATAATTRELPRQKRQSYPEHSSAPHEAPNVAHNARDANAALPPATEPQDTASAPESVATEAPVTPSPVPSDSWPPNTRLSYRLRGYYRGDLYGSGQVQWQRSDGHYQVQIDLRMALIVTASMTSQGEITQGGLLPQRYQESVAGTIRHLSFDGGVITLQDGSTRSQPLGVQDTASQFVELSRRFASGGDPLQVGSEVPVWLARPSHMNLWTYDVVALETLPLPELGPTPAFHLRPRPLANPSGTISAEMWFAPGLQYLPVRIRISLGGENYVDLLVERIEQG
jgi:hypothetical protein